MSTGLDWVFVVFLNSDTASGRKNEKENLNWCYKSDEEKNAEEALLLLSQRLELNITVH